MANHQVIDNCFSRLLDAPFQRKYNVQIPDRTKYQVAMYIMFVLSFSWPRKPLCKVPEKESYCDIGSASSEGSSERGSALKS